MDEGLTTLFGMSLAYVASFAGMALAGWSWRKRHRKGGRRSDERSGSSKGQPR